MSEKQTTNESRRGFVAGGVAAAAGLAIAPGVTLLDMAHARPENEAASGKNRWGLLIDTTKCKTGCTDCVTACFTESGVKQGDKETDPQWIRKVELKDLHSNKTASLPMMCQHCAHPPGVDVCPTGASFKRVDGIVLVDRHICIGCRYCMSACPYGVRKFNWDDPAKPHQRSEYQEHYHYGYPEDHRHEGPLVYSPLRPKGIVENCTFCAQYRDNGELPACVRGCPGKARFVGDLHDK